MSTLLLVADAAWVRNDVEAALSDPATVLEVTNDPDAVAGMAATTRFDAIIVDMQVRSMGGVAITRLLKDGMAQGDIEPAPVILLLDRRVDVFLAHRAKCDAHVVKPFTAQDLRAALAAVSTATPQ